MKYRESYQQAVKLLQNVNITDAVNDAEYLLEYVCKTTLNDMYMRPDRELTNAEYQEFQTLLQKRSAGIPLQHLTGIQEFMGLPFIVNENVLIPRQDTETLVEEVLRFLWDGAEILDMCTGSGCVLLSLLHFSNECHGTGVDLSEKALETAMQNAKQLGIEADFIQSDLFQNIDGKFDMIVSNPPYIQSEVIETLATEVKDYEPRMALDGDKDGLKFYRAICAEAGQYLKPDGMLFFEIGYDEKNEVMEFMNCNGFQDIYCIKDLSGNDRVVYGTWKK